MKIIVCLALAFDLRKYKLTEKRALPFNILLQPVSLIAILADQGTGQSMKGVEER